MALVRFFSGGLRLDFAIIVLLFASLLVAGFLVLKTDPEIKAVGWKNWKPPKGKAWIAGNGLIAGGGAGLSVALTGAVEGKVSQETITLAILIMSGILVAGIVLLLIAIRSTASTKLPQ